MPRLGVKAHSNKTSRHSSGGSQGQRESSAETKPATRVGQRSKPDRRDGQVGQGGHAYGVQGVWNRTQEKGTWDVARGYSEGSWRMQGQYRMITGHIHVKYEGSTGHAGGR